jgi:hypothetical protein
VRQVQAVMTEDPVSEKVCTGQPTQVSEEVAAMVVE